MSHVFFFLNCLILSCSKAILLNGHSERARWTGTPDIFEDLRKTEIIVIKTTVALSLEGRDRLLRSSESIFNCTSQVNWSWSHSGWCCPIETTCQASSQGYGARPRNHRRDAAGRRRGGVGWRPPVGTERPIGGKILLWLFFLCWVPHEFKCSWPAKIRWPQFCCHHHSLEWSWKENSLGNLY